MRLRQLVTGAVVGAVVMSLSGYALFWLSFGDFYEFALKSGTVTGVARESPLMWAAGLSALAHAVLLTLVIRHEFNAPRIRDGAWAGAVLGFLVWFTADLMLYSISNVFTLSVALVAPLCELVPSAVSGAAIALTMRVPASA